jgi:hypothetical protein
VEKVVPPLPVLMCESTRRLAGLAAQTHPLIGPAVENERFFAFLASCALVPDGLRIELGAVVEMVKVTDEVLCSVAKEICSRFRNLYEISRVPSDVIEFAMSGVHIPDLVNQVADYPFTHWLEKGFCRGDVGEPLSVPFPVLASDVGKIVPDFVQFVNWGQSFYWQHFEALVPHIIRLRCSSLYRVKQDHQATLKEIFGSGPATIVNLLVDMSVVTCSAQWLVKKVGNQKQLKVDDSDSAVAIV